MRENGIVSIYRDDGIVLRTQDLHLAFASGKGNNATAFPLVPYSNRIANGHLVFAGEEITLAPNWPGLRHPMHGEGWARAWDVARHDGHTAELVHERKDRLMADLG